MSKVLWIIVDEDGEIQKSDRQYPWAYKTKKGLDENFNRWNQHKGLRAQQFVAKDSK